MYQEITIVGNLGDDPRMQYTPSGQAVADFPVAVNKRWTAQDGTPQESTTWFRITVWGKQAEVCSQYLTKGRQILAKGEMKEARAYINRDGQPAAQLEINARQIIFLGGGVNNASANGAGHRQTEPEFTMEGDDVPF
ncbi:MAG: single-stranded DNA-binding protein [Caldilineaceae bacterium]|nr:single-stranded DNA-binding protein [Caldilineaceae bacterium]